MWRAATRWTGSASSGISTARLVNCCRNRTAPDPPHSTGSGSAASFSPSASGELSSGPQTSSPPAGVERRRDLAAARVEHGGPLPPARRLAQPAGQRVERADAAQRQSAAQAQRPGRGDADAQAGERAGAGADGDPADGLPAARRGGGALDLAEQRSRVLRAALLGQPEQRLVQQLPAARRGDRGVAGGGVEADDRRLGATCRVRAYGCARGRRSGTCRPACPPTNQVTVCLPGMFVVILLT